MLPYPQPGSGRTRKQTTYQYQTNDNPVQLAQQFNTTPESIFSANPGGYPFTTGQTINIPNVPAPPKVPKYNPLGQPVGQPATVHNQPPVAQYQTNYTPNTQANAWLNRTSTGTQRNTRDLTLVSQTYKETFDTLARQYDLTGTFDPAMLPKQLTLQMQEQLGFPPENMQAMGYSLQGNKWVQSGAGGGGATSQPTRDAQGGAAPFGVNASGARLDSSGNVWDPSTAKRDIYGGRFIQVGEVRWERNKNGRLVKVKYLGGGKKKVVQGGKNQSNGGEKKKKPVASQGNFTGSENVSFGAGAG